MKVIKVLVKNNSLIVEELYQKNFEDSDNIMYFTLKYIKYNKDKVKEIAEMKMPDLNAASIEAAMSMIAGTARSMGITVED